MQLPPRRYVDVRSQTEPGAFPRRVAALAGVIAAAEVLLAAGPAGAASGSETFGETGAEQTFVVPPGVTQVHVVAAGAPGGAGGLGTAGGFGARVAADLAVTPGVTLYVLVGGRGADSILGGAGGFGGGGAGSVVSGGGGGGGSSELRSSSCSA